MRIRHLFTLSALALGACTGAGPELVPAPGVTALPAPSNSAMAEASGVRLEIKTDAWRGTPTDLGDNFTPVLVTVTNDGDKPLRIRYADYMLHGPTNEMYHALPPFKITDTVTEPITDVSSYRGFLIAPYLSPYYPRMRVFSNAFLFDELYFNRYYPSFVEIQLPTSDMIQKALPEGVLEPGGRVSGFLYFQDPEDEVGRVRLTHDLVTPDGQEFGRLEIPLETRN